jgi:hypothetical protein
MAAGRVYYQPSAFDPASARGSDEIAAPDSALTGWSAAATIAARLGDRPLARAVAPDFLRCAPARRRRPNARLWPAAIRNHPETVLGQGLA